MAAPRGIPFKPDMLKAALNTRRVGDQFEAIAPDQPIKYQTRRLSRPKEWSVGDEIDVQEAYKVVNVVNAELRVLRLQFDVPDLEGDTEADFRLSPSSWQSYLNRKFPARRQPARYLYAGCSRFRIRILRLPEPHFLQEITEKEAIAEGVEKVSVPRRIAPPGSIIQFEHESMWKDYSGTVQGLSTAYGSLSTLWDSIHQDPDNQWDSNPVIFPIEFEIFSAEEAVI